ncbi:MAG: PLP-dependent aminotransferase family protein [Lachnospiraceae bacterium]|nr:PLP-dependent aminotransferase family protein [Lachnospiraceae bacterium]
MMKVYETIYDYYVRQIKENTLQAGDQMPSIRESERILNVSRTSVETAYFQLAADGYIYAIEKVGYFVSKKQKQLEKNPGKQSVRREKVDAPVVYDLSTIGEDRSVSCLQLWRRYMKSALRQEERLLRYAGSQGEEDLREEIAAYVRKTRNILCSAQDIVIGAGFQNLLQILIALIPGEKSISFPTREFAECAQTFQNAGYRISYRDKECHVLYVTPSQMTRWGEVMTMQRRREIIEHCLNNHHLLIEDDYQHEFVFSGKPTPSLYAMTAGEQTAFLGSFSRVLLPSVRISFLILPRGTQQAYQSIGHLYHQTASIAEQIALTQFLRDGHLQRHIKKMRRIYEDKRQCLIEEVRSHFVENAEQGAERNVLTSEQGAERRVELLIGESGTEIGLRLPGKDLRSRLPDAGVAVQVSEEISDALTIILSCSRIGRDQIAPAVKMLSHWYFGCRQKREPI